MTIENQNNMISRRRKSTPVLLSKSTTSATDEGKRTYSASIRYIIYLLLLHNGLLALVSINFDTIASHDKLHDRLHNEGDSNGKDDNNRIVHEDVLIPPSQSYDIKFSEEIPERPIDWETWSYHDMHEHSCDNYNNDHPVPSLEYWKYLQKKYIEVVDPSYQFDDKVPPTLGYSTDEKGTPPFYYAKISPGKGRGIYASRDIKKGEAFDDGTYVGTIFPDEMAYRRFIFSLPKDMACDATMWTWTQRFEKDGPFHIIMAFEISALLNSSKAPNAVAENEFSTVDIATRDIKKDEEILTDYNMYPTRWGAVGLGRKRGRRAKAGKGERKKRREKEFNQGTKAIMT